MFSSSVIESIYVVEDCEFSSASGWPGLPPNELCFDGFEERFDGSVDRAVSSGSVLKNQRHDQPQLACATDCWLKLCELLLRDILGFVVVMPFRFSFEAKYQVKGAEQIRDRSSSEQHV